MSLSVHVDIKRKDILILGEWSTQGLGYTTLTAKAKYPINFTRSEKDYTIMEATVFCLVMLKKYINSKQKTQK